MAGSIVFEDESSGTQKIVSTNNPLPTSGTAPVGGATSSKQDIGNTSLGNIDSKLTTTFSTANSSTTPLGIGGVYTGTSEDITKYAEIRVLIFSDQASATDGLAVEQSPDGINWDLSDSYTIPANTNKSFGFGAVGKFFRVVYTNGAVAQGTFRLQVKLNVTITKPSSVRPQDGRSNENDFEEDAVYLHGYNGTSWDRLRATIGNGLAADVTRVVPGTTTTSLGKAEDAASASGDTGVFALGVRRDTLTVSASATGDYNEQAVDKYGALIVKPESTHKRTYSASATVVPAASATDVLTIIGSASTTVMVTRVVISGTQTTGGLVLTKLIKRTAVNTGGTSGAVTSAKHETADAAATAVVNNFSANPSGLGAGVTVRSQAVPVPGVTATTSDIVVFDFGDKGKPIVLAGVAECLAINLNGVTVTGGSLNIDIEFTEE
jgi:hypothetical protein